MMISNTLKSFENENENLTLIRKFLFILSVLLIIFTIIFFTCFGCFLVLNDSTSWAAQTVTLSSEGVVNQRYPDSMGEYQLAGEIRGYNWYRHEDKKDSFLMYNNIGNFKNILEKKYLLIYLQIIVGTSPTPIMQRM